MPRWEVVRERHIRQWMLIEAADEETAREIASAWATEEGHDGVVMTEPVEEDESIEVHRS